jgi:hypothetical protein
MITTYYKDPAGNIQKFISHDMKSAEESIRYLINTGYSISDVEHTQTKCRVCGCDDDHACKGGCFWIEPDLCSQCYEKSQLFSIKLRNVEFHDEEMIDNHSEVKVIAEEIPEETIAEGFIYGYAAAMDYEDLSDVSLENLTDEANDEHKTVRAIGISIWKNDEVITEFFFKSDEVL